MHADIFKHFYNKSVFYFRVRTQTSGLGAMRWLFLRKKWIIFGNQGFYDTTALLRQDLAEKRGEYNALIAASNSDPKRAAKLSREIATLHDQLRVQARPYNLRALNNGY